MANENDASGSKQAKAAFDGFLREVVSLARAVSPEIADTLDPGGAVQASAWNGTRDRGVRLCLSMLRYARAELASDREAGRLDSAIQVAETVLGKAGAASATPTNADLRARFEAIESQLAARAARPVGSSDET